MIDVDGVKYFSVEELTDIRDKMIMIANEMADFYEDPENEAAESMASAYDELTDYIVDVEGWIKHRESENA